MNFVSASFSSAIITSCFLTRLIVFYKSSKLASLLLHAITMARVPRHLIIGDDCIFHVTWQAHNKDWLLQFKWAKQLYYDLLLRFKDRYGLVFYSYMFMDNHIHLSGRLSDLKQFSAFFRIVNSMFAKMVNIRKKRCGQVVRDRFKSPCLQREQDLIQEMIYHDLNEVRAGKSAHPKENQFSSYAHYAQGKADALLTDPDYYLKLGKTDQERQSAYRAMVMEILRSAPRKRDNRYTQDLFIGDPYWVLEKYREFKSIWSELRKASSHSPP